MSDQEITRRAEHAGVQLRYRGWRGEEREVGRDVITAILAELGPDGDAGSRGGRAARGQARAGSEAAALPRWPERRTWGLAVQLYSVRSRRSWGLGDLRDLADLAAWSARELGADFILVNPLHAGSPVPPAGDSPYLPMSRRYVSPLYLRIEDIPEYPRLPAEQRHHIERLAAPLRAASATPDLIDRDRIGRAKLRALQWIHAAGRSPAREAEYRAYADREGAELTAWATWCALAEEHGPDWRSWPAGPQDAAGAIRAAACGPLAGRVSFHAWTQWLIDEQLAAAQGAARAAGMEIGVIGDLAVGVHPGGADAWARQGLLVRGMSVGAPPDEFNQRGQDWSQPPWHPRRLAAARYEPLAGLFRAALAHAGGVRVDHVMGLARLWWIPEGMPPARGAYVRYDHRATVGALTGEAARAGALAIGEDLGTVDPWIRRYLARHHVLGTEMAWFAREPDGSPLRPARWRRGCMATAGTHDVPPVSAFVTGEHVAVRERLGLLGDPEDERRAARLALSSWHDALAARRLLAPGRPATPEEFTVAMYGYLARTRSLLVAVAHADAVGERRSQNVPGTSDEYPNWRVPLCDAHGRAVLVEDLPRSDLLRAVAGAVSARGAGR